MYLKKVHIQNIKSIKDFEMEFDEPAGWHVLIGENGSGKTTILRAIALGLIGKDDIGGVSEQDWNLWIKEGVEDGLVQLIFSSDKIDFEVNRKPFNESMLNRLSTITIDFPHADRVRPDPKSDAPYDRNITKGWFSASFGPYRRFENGSGEWETIHKNMPRLARHLSAFKSSATFPHTLAWIQKIYTESFENKENRQLESIIKLLNSPGFLPNGTLLSHVTSKGVFFQNDDGVVVPLSVLSDGYRTVLSLALELIHQLVLNFGSELVFRNHDEIDFVIDLPGVVLIDEIDVHLHPNWQTHIGQWFTKYFPRIQFIVTTHSPLICRACEKGSIWRLVGPDSKEKSGRVSEIDANRLIYGNILDAYGTEVFGAAAVRTAKSDEKLSRLGRLNMLFAYGKITEEEENERRELQLIFTTDDPTGY